MKTAMNIQHIISALSLGVLLVSVSCSGKAGDYCDKEKDCEGGNDADRDACVASANATSDVASDYDCGDKYDDYFDCLADKSTCNNGRLDNAACASQSQAYSACVEAAKGKRKDVSTSSSSGTVVIDGGK